MAKGAPSSTGRTDFVSGAFGRVNARLCHVLTVCALCALALSPVSCGCAEKTPAPGPSPADVATRCERLPIPAFVTGANVIDHPDDKDDDPSNDGKRGYGSEKAERTLDRLAKLGLTGVVLSAPVYATGTGATEVRPGPLHTEAGLARLGEMIDDAHARGLIVTVVPHLMHDDGSWRGDLEPKLEGESRAEAIAAFFDSYTRALLPLVEVAEAHCAEALSVAVELKSMSRDAEASASFRGMIKAARDRFGGGLTYSANWDEVKTMLHWAELDGIGVNAFYPLTTKEGASPEELAAGARAIHDELLVMKSTTKQPIWFMEVGFKAIPNTAIEPWLWPAQVAAKDLPVDEKAQADAYRAVAGALRAVPAVDAAFFWAVPADPEDRDHPWRFEPKQGFSFLGKQAETVVQDLTGSPPTRN